MFVRCTLDNTQLAQTNFSPHHGHTNRPPANKTPAAEKLQVTNFIKVFSTLPSHYCSRDTKLLYLEPGWSIAEMCDLYKKETDENKQRSVSKKIFASIFKEMSISFYNPSKDQCDMCVGYRENSVAKSDKHVEDKERARHFKSLDKELANANKSVKVLTMDCNNSCYVQSRLPRVFTTKESYQFIILHCMI